MFRTAILVAVLSCAMYGLLRYFTYMGAFNRSFKHYPGSCKQVKGARHGSEDIAWTSDGLAFITSGLPLPDIEKHFISTGSHSEIQLFNFKDPDAGVTDLKITPSKGLDLVKMRPHGISVSEDTVTGEHILFVVNHPAGEHQELVEKFRYHPSKRHLTHLDTIHLDNSNFFNGIASAGEDKFYISNYAYMPYKSALFHVIYNLLPLRLGEIYYFNGTEAFAVTPSIASPNGVAISKDGKHVYVASTMEESLYVYRRDLGNDRLSLVQQIFLGVKGDNLNLSPNGNFLLLPAHPVMYKMLFHIQWSLSPNCMSPSSVLQIPLGEDGLVEEKRITELFYDHGDLISGSSAAVVFNSQLLIGSVANSLVHCQNKLEF